MAILPYAVVPPGLIPPRIDGPEMANPNVRSQPGCTRRSPYRPAWWASICECSWSQLAEKRPTRWLASAVSSGM